MRTEASIRPVLVAGLGVALLSVMDAVMKVVSAAYPISEVVGLRYLAGAIFASLAFAVLRGEWPSRDAVRRNLVRAVIVLCTATCFFTAIARLPLVEAITLTFLAPLLMAVLGFFILREPVSPRTLIGIGLGLVGVAVIAHGQQVDETKHFDLIGLAAALGCAFFYALSMVLMRQQSAKDSTITIVALSNVFALVLITPLMLWTWQPPTTPHLLVFTAAGLLGTLGHLCMAWAYSRAHAGRLGLLEYTAFVWAMIFGYFVFTEIPTTWTLGGATLIMVACLFALLRR
jgi:S-adenosylmethionine uptake transporter